LTAPGISFQFFSIDFRNFTKKVAISALILQRGKGNEILLNENSSGFWLVSGILNPSQPPFDHVVTLLLVRGKANSC
jgi:hypothetical protein